MIMKLGNHRITITPMGCVVLVGIVLYVIARFVEA